MTAEEKDYINRLLGQRKPLLISRKEVIKEIGQSLYYDGVRMGYLNPIKGKAQNARVNIRYKEVVEYLDTLAEG